MPEDLARWILVLKDLYAFWGMNEEELARLLEVSQILELGDDEVMSVGGDEKTPFFLVLSGKVLYTDDEFTKKRKEPSLLKVGEFFGADFSLFNRIRKVTVTPKGPVQLLCIQSEDLEGLLKTLPPLRAGLLSAYRMHRLVHSHLFPWIGEDELVHLIARRHPSSLLVDLILPLVVLLGAGILFLISSLTDVASFHLSFEWLGFLVLASGLAFGAWRWIDWGNDYYVVTDRRVAWVEHIVGLYDSRQEALLNAVRNTEIRTSQIGRILGFGDLIVFALMGNILFHHIGNPRQVKTLVDRMQRIASERVVQSDTKAMERVIRRKIEPPAAEVGAASPPASTTPPPQTPPKSLLSAFGDFFKTRLVDGPVITYRKHIYILLRKTWLPTILELGLIGVSTYLVISKLRGGMIALPVELTILIAILVSIGLFLWWLYNYIDWRNDIYQITIDRVIDSERKPLGSEKTNSALLTNIQSMDYERKGLLGLLLNYGNVLINTGTESKFIFFNIHDPSRAMRDIFDRIYENQRKKQLSEAGKQWEQVSDWLAAYHRQAEDLRKNQGKKGF